MPTKPKNEDRRLETGVQSFSPSTVYTQPWWHGVGNGAMSSSLERTNGSIRSGAQSQDNGDGLKEKNTSAAPQSGLNRNDVQEHLKHGASTTPPVVGEQRETNSQMELVSHSIVLTSYPYQDPLYGGMMTYGAQVHPHLLGMHQTRMPLPLEMEEEPVYVNAKQYHGILRRRQSRAKAELEKKVTKSRKPYLHESRHQHAMKRARGCGGRFLNTKTSDSNVTNPRSEKEPNYGVTVSTLSVNSSGSKELSPGCDGNSYQLDEKRPMFQQMHKAYTFSNGNSNGHGLSSVHHLQSTNSEAGGDGYIQERGTVLANRASYGNAPLK